jgi:hypothetical protein
MKLALFFYVGTYMVKLEMSLPITNHYIYSCYDKCNGWDMTFIRCGQEFFADTLRISKSLI